MNLNNKLKRLDIFIAFSIGISIFLMIFQTSDQIGFVRDEGFYMKAASNMADWFEFIEKSFAKGNFGAPFSKTSVDKFFAFNSEHPPFMKELFGLSQYLFERKLGIMNFAESCRFVSAIFAALTAIMIYLFSAIFFNRATGVISSLFFFLMPHIFFHSHLACFDIPILFFWSGTFILYVLSIKTKSSGLQIFTAIFFGLAMGTKHNVLFIPIVLFASRLLFYFVKYRKEGTNRGFKGFFKSIPKIFYLFVFISIPLYFLIWPWMWFDTANRFANYLSFHMKHVNYTNYYFGSELSSPPFPFSFPWAMTLFTTPLPQLLFFVSGVYFLCVNFIKTKETTDREALLALLNGSLFPIFLIALPNIPIFGGIKHWFTGYPLMMTCGVFFIIEALKKRIKQKEPKKSLIVAAIFLFSAFSLIPLNLKFVKRGAAFYNQLIGGVQGAAEAKMQRNFWGYDILELVETLNKTAPRNAKLYVMGGYEGLNWNSFLFLKKEGVIRQDIIGTNSLGEADFALFFYEKQNERILNEIAYQFGAIRPIALSTTDSVFYSALFRRRK